MHLTDEQLNEYLDNEIANRTQVELHLSSCANCAERLSALRALFDEIGSLPEISFSQNLAIPITRRVSGHTSLPRSLRLAVTLQAVTAIAAMIFAAPFVTQFISPYLSSLQAPPFVEMFLRMQMQWVTWLDMLSQLKLLTMPEIPVIESSSLFMMITVASVSLLWLIGNGLLLRNLTK
jgi:hypothetical protein